MLVRQKLSLIVRFFNWISCNKGLKAKISIFVLSFFFCLTPLPPRPPPSEVTLAEEIQKSASSKLREWRKNMVIVENGNFLKVNRGLLLMIWVKWKQSVCSIILLYSITFYSLFVPLFVQEIFIFKYKRFFVRDSASIYKLEWFE